MSAKTIVKIACLTLILSVCGFQLAAAQTQDEASSAEPMGNQRWYQVEMIVFSRSENASQQEVWPKNIALSYPSNLISLKPAEVGENSDFVQLKAADRQLNSQAATIAKSGSYSLLFHQAWRQMIEADKTSLLITGGKTFSGHHELEGSIDLQVAQYLQLQTNLWLTQFVAAQAATEDNDGWPELPAIPSAELNNGEMRISDSSDQSADYVTKRTVKINQQRSMRSGEVHYLDHPLLGIIVKIVPYDAPKL